MNRLLKDSSKSFRGVWFAAVIFFAVCVIFPLLCAFLTPDASDVKSVFASAVLRTAMRNTVIECLASTFISVITGYLYAYAVARVKVPFKKFFAVLPVVHLVTPPFVGGLAFILLLGRQGFITKTLLHLDVSLYGFWGLLIAQVLCFFPVAYLICLQTLRGINPALEQAARGMGAGPFRIFWSVTLPLSLPGLTSALLFIAVSVLSDFGNPLIVAGRFRVLAVEVYSQLTGWVQAGKSVVLGLLLLVPSAILFIAQNKLLKKNMERTATLGGKLSSPVELKSSRLSTVLFTILLSFLALCVASQFAAIAAGSFQKLWGINTAFTLDHIRGMGRYLGELKNSVLFSLIAAVLATVIASLVAYTVHRTNEILRPFMDIAVQLPSAVPGSLFGLSLAIAANLLKFRLSGVLIIIAMTVSFLPFSYRIMTSTLMQLRTSLDDGARSLGAGRLYLLRTVLLPMAKGGVLSSFMYVFARGVGTLSSVIFLVSFNTPLASVCILNLAEQGDWGKSACLALVLTLISFGIMALGRIISNRMTNSEWSGR